MKKILVILICSLIGTSCTFNKKEIIIIKTLNQFDTQDENEQLGIDLLNYRFSYFLQQEFPYFTQETLKNISWQYFIQENNKEVSFRLILNNDAIKYKDKITKYFEETVEKQVEKQIEENEFFDNAIKITLCHLELLDKHNFDEFWNNTSEILRQITTKNSFIKSMESRKNIEKIGSPRKLYYKQYYENMPGTDKTGFYVICYTFENDRNIMEQITYHKEEDELKIIGYERTPK